MPASQSTKALVRSYLCYCVATIHSSHRITGVSVMYPYPRLLICIFSSEPTGIFNEYTLRHCSTNITHDIEGYKSLIARPYESVNRAMAGSYYSDVERTIYLTYVCLVEDIRKYDELFQNERKYISFEYWNDHFLHHLEYDDLVYGHEKLSEIYEKHDETRDGLIRFLYEIILRRMEIRDESRSVNSIDIVFNFDAIGFTGYVSVLSVSFVY